MIEEVLEQRGGVHGHFRENADCAQQLKLFVRGYLALREDFTPVQLEALDNICQKLARILVGDPKHIDHWLDIAGYATLVVRDLDEHS